MIKKITKIIAVGCIVGIIWNTNALAADASAGQINLSKEQSVQDKSFEKLIETIVKIKEQNTGWSEDKIIDTLEKNRGIQDIWSALTSSEKKLTVRYPLAALKVNDARNIATRQTERKFGFNGLGDKSDAFRHGIWNAEMTILIGEEKAELFATAHEDKDTNGYETDGFLKIAHKEMDLHNNEAGRKIGKANSFLDETSLTEYIFEAVMNINSEFIWLHD